jgi:D-glycero-alpha-D-manno-heptose-7-phosphate kinase
MIISKTPFRISFVGGGTDFRVFYENTHGAVVSTAINKHMYITVNDFFEKDKIITKYSRTELVDDVEKLENSLIRECLKHVGLTKGIEVTSMADIPGASGLGSSSSFTVGMLNALYAFQGKYRSPEALAREASMIEIEKVGSPIGKQDQYASAYGGLRYIQFNPDESVFTDHIVMPKSLKSEMDENMLLFYTGINRKAGDILSKQTDNARSKLDQLTKMRDLAIELRDVLSSGDLSSFGELLHRNWELKKQIVKGVISNPMIDGWYNKAMEAGALGGKVLGAGGGGFLLFYADPGKHIKIRNALKELREEPFSLESQGSRIVFIGD